MPELYFEYMVAYNFREGNGRMSITTNKLLNSYERLEQFDTVVKDHTGFTTAFIFNIKLLKVGIRKRIKQ